MQDSELCAEPKSSLNVLHVAAFGGNLGDYINHTNFRSWLESHFEDNYLNWNRLDLREVWRGDRDLERAIRSFEGEAKPDLIVVGGGNFWETWDDSSASGTSINMTAEQFKDLDVPVFFNSIGVEIARGISKNAKLRFVNDLSTYLDSNQFFTTVRNDGAVKNLRALGFSDPRLRVLPDAGFFVSERKISMDQSSRFCVLLNLAEDFPDLRYSGFADEADFLFHLAAVLKRIAARFSVHFHFEAHVPGDLYICQRLMRMLPESILRDSFSVRYSRHSESGLDTVLSDYQRADLVVAQRFHSSILGLRLSKDVVSISNHPQILDMMDETSAPKSASFPIFKASDFMELETRIERSISGEERAGGLLDMGNLETQRMQISHSLAPWFQGHGFRVRS